MTALAALIADLAREPPGPFWGGWLLAIALAGGLLYGALRSLARARTMENTPTALIRSAAQGYTELRGMAELMDGAPIIAPVSLRRCVWFRYRVEHLEQQRGGRNERRWVTVDRGESDDLFQLVDTSGKCAVDPDGASVYPGRSDTWYGSERTPGRLPRERGPRWLRWTDGLGKTWRYTEHLIQPGDPLYVIGLFTTHASHTAPLNLEEEVGERLRAWKRDQRTLLRRFDQDGDGRIDAGEWAMARAAAEREVHEARTAGAAAPPPVDVIGQTGDRRRPYVISAKGDDHVIARSRRLAAVLAASGATLASLALWAAAVRLG